MRGSAGVIVAEQTYLSAMDRIRVRRRRLFCYAPAGLPARKLFPEHGVHFLSSCLKNWILFEM